MGYPVFINVYDMSPANRYLGCLGLGIYHTGVEVNNIEYSYGGHEGDGCGIFTSQPRMAPGPVAYTRSVHVGNTEFSQDEILSLVRDLADKYRGNRYHLLSRNCNHFTAEYAHRLTRQRAPGWMNRLAELAVACHCLLPSSWVPPLEPPRADSAYRGAKRRDDGGLGGDDVSSLLLRPPVPDSFSGGSYLPPPPKKQAPVFKPQQPPGKAHLYTSSSLS